MKKPISIAVAAMLLVGCTGGPKYFVKPNNNNISFYARIPGAKTVYLVSNATNFKKVKAVRVKKNLWKASIPYKHGLIKYFYIVDGHVFIPPCKSHEYDGFGGKDCVYVPNM